MVTQWSRSQEIAKTVHNAAQMPTRMDPQDGKYQLSGVLYNGARLAKTLQ